jgi:preprotein translocase subunit SecG
VFQFILTIAYALVCLVLLLVVLLQQGNGGDIASAFGGSGSQAAFGARSGATFLTKATTVLGAVFMLGALVLAIFSERGPTSVVTAPSGPASAPITAPATPGTPAANPGAPPPAQSQPATAGQQSQKPAQQPPPAPAPKK